MTTNSYNITCGLNNPLPFHALINLRKTTHDTTSSITKLASTQAINSAVFHRLVPSRRNLMRCYAVASTSRSAVLTGRAAACVLGIPFISNTTDFVTVQLTLPGTMKPPAKNQRSPYATYTSRLLPEKDIMEENGIRVTTIPRTFVDLVAKEEDEDTAMTFIEAAFYHRRISKIQAYAEIKSMPSITGKPRALELLATAQEGSESLYETKARRLIESVFDRIPELTSIEIQVPVQSYRIDIVVNGFIGIEIDGRAKTRNNYHALENERYREKIIQNHGYIIIRYHPEEVDPSLSRNDIPNLDPLNHPIIYHLRKILQNHHKRTA
ncbi:hypothetical protein CFELI_02610 [Corynebacterium felinum]|uniref:Very-short-patch-repair endonuclease n=2 Tax=Corynebacterium felinum TaxID=131318 RepID=A0ABU2B877_9CORY|nr:hypothetical protein [Corynebacterium felinum]MDR7354803.1 very-short-patch-repair endonuclease [Corynebacterium felinum]WJY94164.1 hypothetical protein CFELI_02610 [Corynebacterium felinum]